MGNLSSSSGYPLEREANTGYVPRAARSEEEKWRKRLLEEGPAAYQLVGEVTAHQGDDG